MIIAIHQPQYIPWIGYFHKIASVDVFVLLDNVQYKKNEFQNRNKIKTSNGAQWLTVPVKYKFPQKIKEVEINNNSPWQRKHIQALRTNYSKAQYFLRYFSCFTEMLQKDWNILSNLNSYAVKKISKLLHLNTEFYDASELGIIEEEPSKRLIEICKHFKADTYLSGKGGINYLNISLFRDAGISVKFQDFKHPVYDQLYGTFVENLSIIDLIFNCGEKSSDFIRQNQR
jgi:hypothetical protein